MASSLAQQRLATPVTSTTLSKTAARRQIAAQPRFAQPMAAPVNAPTPQMRNTAGQMGPAIGGAAKPGLAPNAVGQQPVVGPVVPGQPDQSQPGGYNFAGLRKDIEGFGPAPALDDALMAKMRAQESQRLGNLYRGQLAELGASAASSGALFGGDVSQLAAGFAAQRGQQEAEIGTKLQVEQLNQRRADYDKQFGLAGDLAKQRAGFEQQTSERLGGQGFTSEEAELDRRFRSGERLSVQEYDKLERARDRAQQTSERVGSQQFTAEESKKQRALVTDESAKDRLSQMALAEKNIEAQRANLDSQLAQAKSENNLDRVQQLTVQKNQLDQDYAQMTQQNNQFLTDFGLRRDVFDRGKTEFDLTRGDQVGQWTAQTFGYQVGPDGKPVLGSDGQPIKILGASQFDKDLQLRIDTLKQSGNEFDRQLAQNLETARMDDITRRYVAQMQDSFNRDLNAAAIDPSVLQTLLAGGGQVADILSKLGIGAGALGSLGGLVGGENPGGGAGGLGGLRDSSGGLSTPVQAAVGAAAAYALFDTFNDPKGWGRTAQAIASGAALGSVLPGIGTVAGAVGGAIVGGLSSAFGPSGRRVAQDEFTKQFDQAFGQLQSGGALSNDPSNPESLAQPQNRLGLAMAFKQAWEEYAKPGVGNIEVSGRDINRMSDLGLVAQVGGGGGSAQAFLIDDPRIAGLAGSGNISQYLDIQTTDKMVGRTHENTQGSLAALIAGGTVVVRDKVTGKVIDLDNPELLKRIAKRNSDTATASAGPPSADQTANYTSAADEWFGVSPGTQDTQVGGTRTDPTYTTPPKQGVA